MFECMKIHVFHQYIRMQIVNNFYDSCPPEYCYCKCKCIDICVLCTCIRMFSLYGHANMYSIDMNICICMIKLCIYMNFYGGCWPPKYCWHICKCVCVCVFVYVSEFVCRGICLCVLCIYLCKYIYVYV